jgi:hypothetical protein
VILAVRERLTRADHQTHRRYPFEVPRGCRQLTIEVEYAPKYLPPRESAQLVTATLTEQWQALVRSVGGKLADAWRARLGTAMAGRSVPNLLTISVDDAAGLYRGAAHRQARSQRLIVGERQASPGLVAGHIPRGGWSITLSAHTVASAHCDVSIQIGADTA